jgi:hypothetical protein
LLHLPFFLGTGLVAASYGVGVATTAAVATTSFQLSAGLTIAGAVSGSLMSIVGVFIEEGLEIRGDATRVPQLQLLRLCLSD